MELLYYPDPRLRAPALPLTPDTADLQATVEAMFETMVKSRGIGLAGPQVGIGLRLVVAGLPSGEDGTLLREVYLNPVILKRRGKVREEEGCLSLPGLAANVVRSAEVTVEYQTLQGDTQRVTVDGLHAKLFQHEIDHLDGILIVDRMTPAELKQWAPLLRELEEDFVSRRRREPAGHRGAAAL